MMDNNQDPKVTYVPKRTLNKKVIALLVVIFVVLVGGMFGFAYLQQQEQQAAQIEEPTQNDGEEPTDDRFAYIDRINATHFFIDGTHTLVGEIPMPTPCDLLEHEVMVAESYPEQVTIDFSVINNAEMCTQVITPARFKVEVEAAPEATFSARIAGRSVPLNLTPAPEGETPEDFEVFSKG